jgi:hypothetical protein
MDHNRAVKSQAVERYLLGEMKAKELADFEEHFFTCEECADEVRAGARFGANARQVLPEFPRAAAPARVKPSIVWWRPPALAWATAALAIMVVYQAGIQVPGLKRQLQPQALASLGLHAATRGGDSLPVVPVSEGPFSVYFDLPGQSGQPSFTCVLTDSHGKVVGSFPAKAPKTGDPLEVFLNRSDLHPGRYTLTVKSATDAKAPQNQFLFMVE